MCRSELVFLDVDTGETITLGDNDLSITETNITFTAQQLRIAATMSPSIPPILLAQLHLKQTLVKQK